MSPRYTALPIASLVDEFVAYARPICDDPATPRHTLRVGADKREAAISFPAHASDGFEVRITVDKLGVRVHSGQLAHAQIDHAPDARGAIEAAFGMVRDLLSPDMRLRERSVGSRVIWACVERFDGGTWRHSYDSGVMLFNYFRRRTESVYTNRQLHGRFSGAGAGDTD
jgi:hypothetical protein